MPVFLVSGRDAAGLNFRNRFEAPHADILKVYLDHESVCVGGIRRIPLTTWPFIRFPWMIMVFPLLAFATIQLGVVLVGGCIDLSRNWSHYRIYGLLMANGLQVSGRIISRQSIMEKKGESRNRWQYTFTTTEGKIIRGSVEEGGRTDIGRQVFARDLLPAGKLDRGMDLIVLYDPTRPDRHVPFLLLPEFMTAQREDLAGKVRLLLGSFVIFLLLTWMVGNILIRLGYHMEHTPTIMEYADGDRLISIRSDNDHQPEK
jgi:hypothetical protein